MPSAVRAGDVYILQIPGDNGETKARRSIILDGAPDPNDPAVVLLIFGCSETKRNARPGSFVRITETDRDFRRLGLANATTFHLEDIRFYDAGSPSFSRPPQWKCSDPARMLELRALLEERLDDPAPIPLLPRSISDRARRAAAEYGALPDDG
jgi:hypothetical protein